MKIGIYDPYLDSLGGGERYMLTIAACLSREHEVSVFWDDTTILAKAKEKLGLDMEQITTAPNIFSPQTSFLKKLLQTQQYDALFFLSDGSLPVSLAKEMFVHFQFPVEWVKGRTAGNKLKLSRITRVFCNSKFTKKFIDKKFGVRSTVVYPPCFSSGGISERKENKKNYILTVGRYNELPDGSSFKKQEFLIEVFKEMVDKGLKDWELIIVSSFLPEHKKNVDAIAKTAGGYPIRFLKNISFSELRSLYQQSKIYWHAAGYGIDVDEHPELVEHFGITTVEAMHTGAVPIVIQKGGQEEIITDGQNGYLWETKKDLIAKTKRVITDESVRNKLAEKAMERANDFTIEKFCSDINNLLKDS